MNISKAHGRLRDLIDLFIPTALLEQHSQTPQQAFERLVAESQQAITSLAQHPQSFTVIHTLCNAKPNCEDYSNYLQNSPSMGQYLLSLPPHLTKQMHAITLPAENKADTLFLVFTQIADPSRSHTHIAAAIATQTQGQPEACFSTLLGGNLSVVQTALQLGQHYKATHSLAA